MNSKLSISGFSSCRLGLSGEDENPFMPARIFSGVQHEMMQASAGGKQSFFRTIILLLLMVSGLGVNNADAQAVNFNGSSYLQDFQTITGSDLTPASIAATTMLQVSDLSGGGSSNTGWYIYYTSSGTPRWGRSSGSSATGSMFGMWNASGERALGSQGSSSSVAFFGTVLKNNTASTITSITISYDAVMVRNPTTTANPYPMSYRISSTNLVTSSSSGDGTFADGAGTWTSGTGFTTPSSGTGAPNSSQSTYSPFVKITGAAVTQTLTVSWGAGQYLYIRWKDTDDSGADSTAGVDNFRITVPTPAPTITVPVALNPASVSTTYGTASGNASFNVAGTNLTAGITVTPPGTNFEVSTSAGGPFANTVTVGSAPTVTSTPVYIRLKASAPATSYSGNIALTSGSASTVNVAISSSTVGKKALTVSSAAANNKTYDRTAAATITTGSLVGVVGGDTVSINSTAGTFASASAGDDINVTAALTINGSSSGNYTITQPTGLKADITPKSLTISGASAGNKTYDGNTGALLSGTLSGLISPDTATLTLTGNFDSPFVGDDIHVTSTSSISGGQSANYTLTQPTALSADITSKALTIINAQAGNKVFDGNTDAEITGTLSGIVGFDDVFFIGTGVFDNAGPGTAIPVTATCTLDGLDSSNYTLTQPTGLSATISLDELDPQEITFDSLPDVVYGDAPFNLTATASSGLTVTYESSNTDVATVAGSTVTIVGVGTATITARQLGDSAYDVATPVNQPLNVTPKELTVSGSADNKVYDNTDAATITGTLNGIVGSDDVTLVGTGIFDSVDVADGIGVTSTSTLSGADAANYTLAQPSGLTANITKLALTVTNAAASNKPYDGNTNATITGAALAGVLGSDVVTVSGNGSFASEDVANGIAVTTALVLSGDDAGNYSLTQPTGLAANITAVALTISGLTGNDKVYNANATATLGGTPVLNGIIGSDDVTVSGTPTVSFNNKNVGTAKPISVSGYTLSGPDAGNYTVSQPTGLTGDVTVASLTISNPVAQNKGFDGTTAAVITGTLSGILGADAATLIGTGTFDTSAVGNNIPVTSTSTVGGADGANYIINPQPTGLTANILAAPSFTQGRLVVTRIGAIGGGSLSNAATAVFLDEYTTSGSAGITVALPTTTTPGTINRITESGSATSEGQLNRSADNKYLVIGGYDATLGTASVNSGAFNRVIARVDKQGTVATSVFTNATHASGFRSVATVDGSRYWTAGNASGVCTIAHQGNTTATTTTAVSTGSPNNLRTVSVQNNQLYVSTGSSPIGIYKVGTGVPSASGQAISSLMTPTGPYAYYMVNRGGNNWNCYVANDTNVLAKFSSADNGASWTARGTVSTAAIYGIVAEVNGSNVDVYFTGTGAIYKLTDTAAFASNITGSVSTLVTASTNTVFRGIAFAPFVADPPSASVLAGTNTICAGGTANLTVTVTGGTAPYSVVYSDGVSNFTVNNYTSGADIPVTPPAGTTYTLVSVTDANASAGTGNSGSAIITVNSNVTYYADADADGFGNPAVSQTTCTGAPLNYVADNTDCNDAQVLYADVDGDGFGSDVKVNCGGVTNNTDCNDAALTYLDADADGYGSATLAACGVANNTDCDDTKSTVHPGAVEIGYNLIDDDCDGSIDEGFPPKATVIMTTQCNTVLPAIDSYLYANLVGGAQGYQWRITTLTGPDAGQEQLLNTPLRAMKLTQLVTYAFATTYKVEVAVYFAGFLQPYTTSACTVSTPAATTELTACPQQVLTNMSDVVYANTVPFATGYRFKITDPSAPSNTQTIDRPVREFRMNLVTAFQVQFNKVYDVEVAVKNTDGSYLPFTSSGCTVKTPVFPTTAIQEAQCDGYEVPTNNTLIYAESYPGAIAYVFNLSGNNFGETGVDVTKSTRAFKLSDFTGVLPGASYNVRVRLVFNLNDGPGLYGKTCTITTPGLARHISEAETVAQFNAVAYPNPFAESFSIDVTTSAKDKVNVKVYDMTGRLLDNRTVTEKNSITIGESYPSDVYNVIVSQGDEIKTLRVVKR